MKENKIVYPVKEEKIIFPQKESEIEYQVEKEYKSVETERKN